MNRNYFLPIVALAIGCLFLIFFSLWKEIDTPVTKEPVIPPPFAPFKTYISGVGVVEAKSHNIVIGSPANRVVDKILVKVGEPVKKGEVLYCMEDRDLKANLEVQQAALNTALARLKKLEEFPRPADLAVAEASKKSAEAELELTKKQYDMVLELPDPRSISQEEKNRRLFAYQQAQAKWEQAEADFNQTKGGAWKPDLEIAHFEVLQAQANLNRTKTEIDRMTVRSPIDGTVLQIRVHEGEYPSSDVSRTPDMIVGDVDEMYLRVSINQLDIPSFDPNCPAVAYLQGNSKIQFPLAFVRVEPFLVNKQTFTNEINEIADTRVLKIIYSIKNENHPIYVGQQMDVFIEICRHKE